MASEDRHTVVSGGRILLRLPDSLNAVGVARRAVDVIGYSIPDKTREDTPLVVSELVTNGLRHGHGGVTLSLALSERGRIRGAVVDEGDGFEVPPGPVEPGPGGLGLPIVAALVDRWGVRRGTTRVWFEMPAELQPAPL
jgi:anti-sigma regulatory factor (Ser/Thr protein kinase)